MTMWERVMSILSRLRHGRDQPAALDAAFAQALLAQERKREAADSVIEAAQRQRAVAEREAERVRQRTAEERASWPKGRTTEIRQLVEDVLARPGVRGLSSEKDRPQ